MMDIYKSPQILNLRSRSNSEKYAEIGADNKNTENSCTSERVENAINDVANNLIANTTCLAIANMFIMKYTFLKLLWGVAFIMCSVMTIQQLYSLTITYFSFPVSSYIETRLCDIEFPRVTFCNLNPIRKSMIALHGNIDLQNFIKRLESKYKYPTADNMTEIQARSKDWQSYQMIIANHSLQARMLMGYQFNDFLVQCSYNGMPCSQVLNFSTSWSMMFGNCFTINPSKSSNLTNIGYNSGLIMTLLIEQSEYLPNLIPSGGVRLNIHEAGSVEIPQEKGFTVPPGFEVSLGLQTDFISRAHRPHGTCKNGINFQNLYNMAYTLETCVMICKLQEVVQQCGCYDDAQVMYYNYDVRSIWHPCTTVKEITCMLEILDKAENNCQCQLPCKEYKFEITQSLSEWPVESYKERIYGDLFDVNSKIHDLLKQGDNNQHESIKSNFLNLLISMKTLNCRAISEKPSYPIDNYLSDIGGSLNLFLGFSLLTGFEILEAIGLLLAYIYSVILRSLENRVKSVSSSSKLLPDGAT